MHRIIFFRLRTVLDCAKAGRSKACCLLQRQDLKGNRACWKPWTRWGLTANVLVNYLDGRSRHHFPVEKLWIYRVLSMIAVLEVWYPSPVEEQGRASRSQIIMAFSACSALSTCSAVCTMSPELQTSYFKLGFPFPTCLFHEPFRNTVSSINKLGDTLVALSAFAA